MNRRVYISGPITGLPDLNRQAFANAADMLFEAGFEPVNPFNNGQPADAPWEQHMRADIAMLVTCDAMIVLPGWEDSRGARIEIDLAGSLGISICAVQWFKESRGLA